MGACNFDDQILVKGDAQCAYDEACKEARDYNGHQEGYSGDIQTTYSFKLFKNSPRYGTKKFIEWEEDILSNSRYGIDKRGLCGCVEITGTELRKMKERRGLKGKKGYRAFYFFGWAAM